MERNLFAPELTTKEITELPVIANALFFVFLLTEKVILLRHFLLLGYLSPQIWQTLVEKLLHNMQSKRT